MTAHARHLFLSHGSGNKGEADALVAYLEARGLTVWIAPRDVRPGMDYSEQLQFAIEQCAAFLVLVTDKANRSPYVRVEVEMAFSLEKPIFPVRTSDIKPGAGLALFLKIKHWTDAFGPGRDASLERLARELNGIASGPVAEHVAEPSVPSAAAYAAAPPAVAAEPVSTDDEIVRAFIGPRAAYYLDQWRRMDARGSKLSWNWPAFFVAPIWLGYRKMFRLMGAVAVASVALRLTGIAGAEVELLTFAATIGLGGWVSANANHFYRRHVEDSLQRLALTQFNRRDALDRAEISGGTSAGGMWGMVALLVFTALVAETAQADSDAGASPPPAWTGGL